MRTAFDHYRTSSGLYANVRAHLRAAALVAALLLTGTSCDSVNKVLSPGRAAADSPARLALNASIPRFQESAFSQLELRVSSEYLRADGSFVALSNSVVPLTDATTQQVPVSIELGTCLNDPLRGSAALPTPTCVVRLTLTLVGDGRTLDTQQLVPLPLTAGTTIASPQSITLFEVGSVTIADASTGAPLPPLGTALQVGGTIGLSARVLDAAGTPITGRTATWTSTNPSVATVSSTGVVTGAAPGQVTISASVGGRASTATVVVTPPLRVLTVVGVPGAGSGRVISIPSGIDCVLMNGAASGLCSASFDNGAAVQLTAAANLNSVFTGWTGACLVNGTAPTCTLLMNEPRTAGAGFTPLITVTVSSLGNGVRIISSPSGILCTLNGDGGAGACEAAFVPGSSVVLTADEFTTARVAGFSGCNETTPLTCTVSVVEDPRLVTVAVTPPSVLSVSVSGAGSGVVSAPGADPLLADPDISCGQPGNLGTGRCSTNYPAGASVVVTANPALGSVFVGWSGGGCDDVLSPTCVVTLDTDVSLLAVFAPGQFPVTLQLSGTGGGTVVINGAPACLLTPLQSFFSCELQVAPGTSLSMSATPSNGGQFLGFGGACPPGPSCLLVVNEALTITAVFAAAPKLVSVRVGPDLNSLGRGGLRSGDNTLNCTINADQSTGLCEAELTVGAAVTILAEDFVDPPMTPYVFARWSDNSPCPNSVLTQCSFIVSESDTVVLADFVEAGQMFVAVFGSGAGVVEIAAANYRTLPLCQYGPFIPDGQYCEYLMPDLASVTVNATPLSGSEVDVSNANFCSWTGQTCTFTLQSSAEGTILFINPADTGMLVLHDTDASPLRAPGRANRAPDWRHYSGVLRSNEASSTLALSKSGFTSSACLYNAMAAGTFFRSCSSMARLKSNMARNWLGFFPRASLNLGAVAGRAGSFNPAFTLVPSSLTIDSSLSALPLIVSTYSTSDVSVFTARTSMRIFSRGSMTNVPMSM